MPPPGGAPIAIAATDGRPAGSPARSAELREVVADDECHVVGIHHNSAERNGKQLDVDCCLLFEIKDGKVVDGREHFDDLYAWDDFWS